MRRLILLLSCLAAITALAGCGNKGPLVMPPAPGHAASVAPATSAPAPATSVPEPR